jgi:ATP-dependent Lon protease
MVAPLVVGRSKSIHALEDAMEKRTEILLVAQQDSRVDDPQEDEIYRVGTLAVVMQLLRLPDGTIKALVEGQRRAEIVSVLPHE